MAGGAAGRIHCLHKIHRAMLAMTGSAAGFLGLHFVVLEVGMTGETGLIGNLVARVGMTGAALAFKDPVTLGDRSGGVHGFLVRELIEADPQEATTG